MAQTPPTFARPVKNAVYDVGTLSWVPMTQPGGGSGGGGLTNAELRAATVPVTLTDAAGNAVSVVDTNPAALGASALVTRLAGVVVSETGGITVDIGTLGQHTMAASIPVAIASDQTVLALETTQAAQTARTDTLKSRSDTFTGTANGVTVDVTAFPLGLFGIQVKGTGASATTWDVRLEGSMDGVSFTQILQHTNTIGDGLSQYSGSLFSPSRYFRSRCAGLVLGSATNVVVTILGVR